MEDEPRHTAAFVKGEQARNTATTTVYFVTAENRDQISKST